MSAPHSHPDIIAFMKAAPDRFQKSGFLFLANWKYRGEKVVLGESYYHCPPEHLLHAYETSDFRGFRVLSNDGEKDQIRLNFAWTKSGSMIMTQVWSYGPLSGHQPAFITPVRLHEGPDVQRNLAHMHAIQPTRTGQPNILKVCHLDVQYGTGDGSGKPF
tara:strand:+ start:10750 stop:11229 length:480 start_codon:yes stop_codon:yes gene_type:complete